MAISLYSLKHAVEKFGDSPAMGWRETIAMIEEEKEVKKVRRLPLAAG